MLVKKGRFALVILLFALLLAARPAQAAGLDQLWSFWTWLTSWTAQAQSGPMIDPDGGTGQSDGDSGPIIDPLGGGGPR